MRVGQHVKTEAEARSLPIGSVLVELRTPTSTSTWVRIESGWLQPITIANRSVMRGIDDAAMVTEVDTYPLVVVHVGCDKHGKKNRTAPRRRTP